MLYYMLSAAADYSNVLIVMVCMYIIYPRVGPVILGPAESSMPWVYCYLTMMFDEAIMHFLL